eukprot:c20622_g1_i2 orf=257-3370(-)
MKRHVIGWGFQLSATEMEAKDCDENFAAFGVGEGRNFRAIDILPLEDGVDITIQWLASRTVCVKRKLEEMDISAAESRPKREPREEMLEAYEDCTLVTLSDCSTMVHSEVLSAMQGNSVLASKSQDDGTCGLSAALGPTISRIRSAAEKDRLFNEATEMDDTAVDNASRSLDDDRYCFAVSTCGTCSSSEGTSSFNECFEVPRCGTHADTTNPMIQFFVRTFSDARTVVIQAHAEDTIELVHMSIYEKTGLPISEQRLIYSGRQLQQHQTLAECQVSNDATLHLVARMLSTPLHKSWQLVNDLVATIHLVFSMTENGRHSRLRLMQAQDKIRANVKEFLKLAAESLPISDHMQVFQLAGATSALVVLLLSPLETNRECAECSIKLFVSAIDDCSSTDIHHYCAPILLDFCKLLKKGAPGHALYFTCRNALACILDTVCVAHGSTYFNDAKAESIVQDFAPLVAELALKLSLTNESPSILHLDAKEGHDFTAFVTPLCKAMEACSSVGASTFSNNFKGISPVVSKCLEEEIIEASDRSYVTLEGILIDGMLDDVDKRGGEIGSHAWLFAVFHGLLYEIDNCLGKVEEALQGRPFNWAPLLAVLKGLNVIAKMYEGCMDTLLTVFSSRCKALNIIIQQSESHNDHFWLLEHKSLLDFESKRTVVLGMLSEPQEDFEERHDFFIHRDHLLPESFHAFESVKSDVLQGGLSVEFTTEEATGPGVLREWFYLICREIFNPENALFLLCPNDSRRVFPNPASGVNPEHLNYFRFSGQVIALALMHKVQVNVVFASMFFKQLAGLPVSWEDVKDADPVLYKSCKQILELDSELVDTDVLGLTFIHEFEELGISKTVELCHGGKDMSVNSQNRFLYVELLVQHRFVKCVEKQVEYFCQGFSDLLVGGSLQQFLQALEPKEFELLLFGKDRIICVDDWKLHTEYHGYESLDCHIIWFWEVVSSMNMEQRRRLLFFSTSVAHLPAEGFVGLSSKFHIHRAHTDITWLPTAHTCFFQLVLPPYPSYEMMYAKLYAIIEGHIFEGFGFA